MEAIRGGRATPPRELSPEPLPVPGRGRDRGRPRYPPSRSSFDVIVVLTVIVAAMVLWITEWWPVDQVLLCIPVVLVIAGVLGPVEAFAGFAGTVVVTIAGILVVSDGLVRTGAVQFVGERIIQWSRGDERKLLLVMLSMLVASVFVNNTAIVAMFLPVLLSVAHEFQLQAGGGMSVDP